MKLARFDCKGVPKGTRSKFAEGGGAEPVVMAELQQTQPEAYLIEFLLLHGQSS